MLFDAHVAHLHPVNELVDRHAPGALERIKNFQPLGAADLSKQSLVHGGENGEATLTLHAPIFKRQHRNHASTGGKISPKSLRERKIDNLNSRDHRWVIRIGPLESGPGRIEAALRVTEGDFFS